MQLSEKQISEFWCIMEKHDDVSKYSDSQKAEIANGIANFYICATKIFLLKERKQENADS